MPKQKRPNSVKASQDQLISQPMKSSQQAHNGHRKNDERRWCPHICIDIYIYIYMCKNAAASRQLVGVDKAKHIDDEAGA